MNYIFNLTLVLVCLSSCTQPVTVFEAQKASRPNIIHILADDVGWDDFSCYGSTLIKTPNIDKLAQNGIRFTDYYAPASVCTPSRVSMLSGKYAPKVKGGTDILFPSSSKGVSAETEKLLPRYLKTYDYKTAMIGKWHLGHLPEYSPIAHGFDYYFGLPYCNDHGPERNIYNGNLGWPEIPLLENTTIIEQPVDLANLPLRFVEKVCDFIETNKDEHFYVQYANIETHTPWYVPAQFEGKSAAGPYGDAVEMLDWSVGQIVAKVKALGLEENTLIIITSDNGPLYKKRQEFIDCYGQYGDVDLNRKHILKEGKGSSHTEGGPRVPFVAQWPGTIPSGQTSEAICAGIDFLPTFLYLIGDTVSVADNFDGKNILPLMLDEKVTTPHDYVLSYRGNHLRAVRKGDWKLSLPPSGGIELYNLKKDISETTDLSSKYPAIVTEMTNIANNQDDFTTRKD